MQPFRVEQSPEHARLSSLYARSTGSCGSAASHSCPNVHDTLFGAERAYVVLAREGFQMPGAQSTLQNSSFGPFPDRPRSDEQPHPLKGWHVVPMG